MSDAETKAKIEEKREEQLRIVAEAFERFARRQTRELRLSRLKMTPFLRYRPLNYKFERKK